jgi:hypothetical protein
LDKKNLNALVPMARLSDMSSKAKFTTGGESTAGYLAGLYTKDPTPVGGARAM